MKGRKPKPTALKKLDGNPGNRPLPAGEPTPPPGIPPCPDGMSNEAKKVWFEVARVAAAMGLLTTADAVACEVYCNAVQRYRHAVKMIEEVGAVFDTLHGPKKSPWVQVAKDAALEINQFGAKFGFSPADRARLAIGEKKQVDPFQAFLDEGKKTG